MCEIPVKRMELQSEISTDITPVPWLNLIPIDRDTIFITLDETIEVSILLHPCEIFRIFFSSEKICLSGSLEYIDREPELVFTLSWWSTERVRTAPEIPEACLVLCTAIGGYDDYLLTEMLIKRVCESLQGIVRFSTELTLSSLFIYKI